MTLSPAWLDELRARTVLSAVIAPSVKLIRAGREWKACCPFHNEKTPSFTINDDKHFYHCFGCGAHGDAIRFLTDHRGLPFMDAVKELASKAGMEVPAPDPRAKEQADRRASLTEVTAAAQRWFAEQLNGLSGASARDYCAKRGITPALIAEFGIGLAPDSRNGLKRALADLGEEKLVETGMLIKPDDGGVTYDRFRGRMMIPIRDQRGRVIGFGGRILGEGEPKYLNSPDTPLFDKGRTLYNIDRAGPASRKANRLIVVEGYMDVIGLARAGIDEVVAPNGTAVTEAQLERMWRLDPAPILCFDGDNAGRKAAIRAALRALPHLAPDRTLRFVELPAGQDPDDLVNSGGRGAVEALFQRPKHLAEYLWASELLSHDTLQPEGRQRLRASLRAKAALIKDEQLAGEFRRELENRFWDAFGWGRKNVEKLRSIISESRHFGGQATAFKLHRAILLGLSRYPRLAHENYELVAQLPILNSKLRIWRDVVLSAVMEHPGLDEDLLQTILDSSEASPIEKRDLQRDLAFSFFKKLADPERAKRDLVEVMHILVDEAAIDAALKDANRRLQENTDDAEWAHQLELRRQHQDLSERIAEFRESLAA